MSALSPSPTTAGRARRIHPIEASPDPDRDPGSLSHRARALATFLLIGLIPATGFVLLGGGNLDLDRVEARLGMAASEGLGPLGQVFGGWDPALWPGRLIPSQVWAWGEGGRASSASVRWPDAIAATLLGLIVSGAALRAGGARVALFASVALFGSLGLIHRGTLAGLDLIAGLGVVGALFRLRSRGADWAAGLGLALAFLAGGWPPVAMALLPAIVLERPGSGSGSGSRSSGSWRVGVPLVLAMVGWSFWVIRAASAEALAAALTLPLTTAPAWTLPIEVLVLGLPWSPFALLAAWRSVRETWEPPLRDLLAHQFKLGIVAILAGTLIPGLAPTARLVALIALALTTGAVLATAWSGVFPARRALSAIALGVVGLWATLAIPVMGYISAAVSYYRAMAITLLIGSIVVVLSALALVDRGRLRGVILTVAFVAIGLKLAHVGIYVPEWNYRVGQGAWGRAIGRWVPPNQPIYTFHAWPEDLMFHTNHPVRQLPDPVSLKFRLRDRALFVLLLPSEFEHWPRTAPPLRKIRELEDAWGASRIVAATDGRIILGPVETAALEGEH